MSQRLCQPFTKCHHTPTVRLFPHPPTPLFCFGLIWLGLCSFPPHATCGTQFLILALLHFKPVKKLGGTFVLTTPGPSERGECVVQILKKVVAPDLKKKNKLLAAQNNTSSYIEDLIGFTSPCLFCYHMPLSCYLNHRNCHSRNSSHSDPWWWWWWCRDGPHGQTHVIELWTHMHAMGFNCNLQKGFHVVWTDPRAGSAWI